MPRALDFALSRILPEDLRRTTYDVSKNGMGNLMTEIARKHPDRYAEIAQKIGDLGRRASFLQGYTIGPEDTAGVVDTDRYLGQMDAELDHLKSQSLPPEEFEDARNEIFLRYSKLIEGETMKAAKLSGNAFAKAVISGARGNPAHVQAILSTPGVYSDAKGNVIPLFVRNSFSRGVRPAESLAGTYGARQAVVATKVATAKGGDFGKILVQSAANYNVVEKDCGSRNGIDLPADDASLRGRVLARDVGDLKAGTVLDKHALAQLRRIGKPVVVRSAMTCTSGEGLCSKCVGLSADGHFPRIGESVGITAAQAVSEPIVQGALSCLVEGTLVRMADYSLREIQQVKEGEMVMGADINGATFPVRVTKVWDQGVKPVYRYTYKMGQSSRKISVACTEIHNILQATEYSGCKDEALNFTARKLPAGRKPGRPSAVLPVRTTSASVLEEPLAGLLGFWMGDGIRWSSKNRNNCTIKLSCADAAVAVDLVAEGATHGLEIRKLQASHDWVIKSSARKNRFKAAVQAAGWEGCYCHEKGLPNGIWGWSDESVARFIAGYWSADGSTHRTKDGATVGVSFGSTSKQMLWGVRELLAVRFCIYGGEINRGEKAGTGNRKNDMWSFAITRRDQLRLFRDAFAQHVFGDKGGLLTQFIAEARPSHFDSQQFFKARRVGAELIGGLQCWDLSVDHEDELFVLENGLIVSNTKHNAGQAKGKKSFSGFDYISQFVQIPEEFKDRAAVSEEDGVVEAVREAPQGGHFIVINGREHFALPGFSVSVKPGDSVEKGDILSDGLANPADIVRLRGLGEGRRYYAERLAQILDDSGQAPDRRNLEIIAKATVDHYRMDDPDEDSPYNPDDLVRSSEFLRKYKPPADTSDYPMHKAQGKYLQQPVLHFTPGTRLTPKMIRRMEDAGVSSVLASGTAPSFSPDMRRLRVASHTNRDWLASMHTSYLSKQLVDSVERGDETNIEENRHFAPRLAYGKDFGKNTDKTGKF